MAESETQGRRRGGRAARQAVRAAPLSEDAVAEYLRESLPPDALVATESSGIIPYYSKLPTIDQTGGFVSAGHWWPALSSWCR